MPRTLGSGTWSVCICPFLQTPVLGPVLSCLLLIAYEKCSTNFEKKMSVNFLLMSEGLGNSEIFKKYFILSPVALEEGEALFLSLLLLLLLLFRYVSFLTASLGFKTPGVFF